MNWPTPILTIAVSIAAASANPATTARAIELRSTNQMPEMVDQNADKVAISNIGNAALNISYLEGDWKSVQIPSGQYVTIPSQSTGLSVSFNDGVETKSLVLNRAQRMPFTGTPGSVAGRSLPTTKWDGGRAAFVRVSLRPQSLTAVAVAVATLLSGGRFAA